MDLGLFHSLYLNDKWYQQPPRSTPYMLRTNEPDFVNLDVFVEFHESDSFELLPEHLIIDGTSVYLFTLSVWYLLTNVDDTNKDDRGILPRSS